MSVCLPCAPAFAETSREPLALTRLSAVFADALSGFALSKDGSLLHVFLGIGKETQIGMASWKKGLPVGPGVCFIGDGMFHALIYRWFHPCWGGGVL